MSSRAYYLSELSYLREHGREFARAHPEAAAFLGEAGSDPDVERLLEGFAFLTGRLRQRLDDEEPTLTKGLLDCFMPAFIRPFPSVSLQQFVYNGGAVAESVVVPRGTEVSGTAGDGQRCTFATTSAVELVPLRVYDYQLDRGEHPCLHLGIEVTDGLSFADVVADVARLHFVADPSIAQCWRLCFLHLCRGLSISAGADGVAQKIPASDIRPVGMGKAELVARDPVDDFAGYQHLVEYWHCPEVFQGVDIGGLAALRKLGDQRRARLTVHLSHLPAPMPNLSASDCQFNCVPAINCYQGDALPIQLDGLQVRYRVLPAEAGQRCYAVQRVSARRKDGSGERVFHPMYRRLRGDDTRYAYHAMPDNNNEQWWLRLCGADIAELVDGIDVLSVDCLVTDGDRPLDLGVGEIRDVLGDVAALVETRNLHRPSRPADPPRADEAYWRLLGRMSLNYRSLKTVDDLRQLLRLYHFAALTDRDAERRLSVVLDALRSITIKPGRRLLHGALISGIDVEVVVDDERIGGDGPIHLLGTVLASVFSHAVSINAYSRVEMFAQRSQERFTWPVHVGRRSIV